MKMMKGDQEDRTTWVEKDERMMKRKKTKKAVL
jgi:hypothetical protein